MSRVLQLQVALALVLVPVGVAAQEPVRSPHGPLRVECSACHTAAGWSVVRPTPAFQHAPGTFPLRGAHASSTCRACHRALDFGSTPLACAACHADIHQGELGADCGRCHSERAFVDRSVMSRQHQTLRFALTGSHVAVDCEACHQSQAQGQMQFVNTPTQCSACHLDRFLATRDPDHAAGGFPQDCTQCHATALWTPARFNHEASQFALTGAHRAVACNACHAGNRFSGTTTTCLGCHEPAYRATSSPPHVSGGFPTDCLGCHTTTRWVPAQFDHAGVGFALTGAHRSVGCDQCHGGGRFAGTPADCVGCHLVDYQATTQPNHVSAGFPQACTQCHGTSAWTGASFDHASTGFSITGRHVGLPCASCHAGGSFTGTPATCVGCHQPAYLASRDPAHQAAGLSTDCAACHTTGGWDGARYAAHDASAFPIYSGAHQNRWGGTCTTCHPSSSNYLQFTCLTCHEHDRARMDDKHAGRSGYAYDSQACYRCHPNGKGD